MSQYALQRQGAVVTVSTNGDVLVEGGNELQEMVFAAIEDGVQEVVLDCEKIATIDASALELLLSIQNSFSNNTKGLRLVRVSRPLREFFTQLRLVDRLNVEMG